MKLKMLFSNLKERLSKFKGKNKKLFVFSIVLIAVLFAYFIFIPSGNEKVDSKTDSKQTEQDIESGYAEKMEAKIEKMLLSLNEVNVAKVMVVCDSTEVYEYLKNLDETKSDNGSTTIREEVVYEKNGSITKPIVVRTKSPKVVGVWIVINAVSASTKLAITNSLKSVLNVDESCINILQER